MSHKPNEMKDRSWIWFITGAFIKMRVMFNPLMLAISDHLKAEQRVVNRVEYRHPGG